MIFPSPLKHLGYGFKVGDVISQPGPTGRKTQMKLLDVLAEKFKENEPKPFRNPIAVGNEVNTKRLPQTSQVEEKPVKGTEGEPDTALQSVTISNSAKPVLPSPTSIAGPVAMAQRSRRPNQRSSAMRQNARAARSGGPRLGGSRNAVRPPTISSFSTRNYVAREKLTTFTASNTEHIIPLVPGITGAQAIDAQAKTYSRYRWTAKIEVVWNPLSPIGTPGTITFGLISGGDPKVLANSRAAWDPNNPGYRSFRAASRATYVLPLSALRQEGPTSKLGGVTDFLLVKVASTQPVAGELLMNWRCTFMGVPSPQSITPMVTLTNGTVTSVDLHGMSTIGLDAYKSGGTVFVEDSSNELRSLHFAGIDGKGHAVKPLIERLQQSGFIPTAIRRGVLEAVEAGLTTDNIKSVLGYFGSGALALGRAAANLAIPIRTALGIAVRLTPKDNFSGTIRIGSEPWLGTGHYSIPVITTPTSRTGGVDKGAWLHEVSKELGAEGLLQHLYRDAHKYVRVVSELGEGSEEPDEPPTPEVPPEKPKPEPPTEEPNPEPPGPGPLPDNPILPDEPDFNDPVAPGEPDVDFEDIRVGYMTSLLNTKTGVKQSDYWSSLLYPPSGLTAGWRGPWACGVGNVHQWDSKKKYVLGKIKMSVLLKNQYMCCESVSYGEESEARFDRSTPGATYLGSVARYTGLTLCRSVAHITDINAFNDAEYNFLLPCCSQQLEFGENANIDIPQIQNPTIYGVTFYLTVNRDAAENFLRNWISPDTGFSNCHGMTLRNGLASTSNNSKPNVHKDVTLTRSAGAITIGGIPWYPDPTMPMEAPPDAPASRDVPIAGKMSREIDYDSILEAGPIYVSWQSWGGGTYGPEAAPEFWVTNTDVSCEWRINAISRKYATAEPYITSLPRAQFSTVVAGVTPPQKLVGGWLCVETYGLGMNTNAQVAIWPAGNDLVDTSIYKCCNWAGPISRTRFVFQIKEGTEYMICNMATKSRPSRTSPAGKDKYYYGWVRMWIVKKKEVAYAWSMPGSSNGKEEGRWYWYGNFMDIEGNYVRGKQGAFLGISNYPSSGNNPNYDFINKGGVNWYIWTVDNNLEHCFGGGMTGYPLRKSRTFRASSIELEVLTPEDDTEEDACCDNEGVKHEPPQINRTNLVRGDPHQVGHNTAEEHNAPSELVKPSNGNKGS